jgi:hypothetical protein
MGVSFHYMSLYIKCIKELKYLVKSIDTASWAGLREGGCQMHPPPSHNYRYIVCQNKQHEISTQTSKGEEHKCKSFTYECDIFRARQQTLYIPHFFERHNLHTANHLLSFQCTLRYTCILQIIFSKCLFSTELFKTWDTQLVPKSPFAQHVPAHTFPWSSHCWTTSDAQCPNNLWPTSEA